MTVRSILILFLLSIASVNLMAQTQPSNEIALDYAYVHTNAPPGGCGCFSMNGGSGSYAYHLGPQFAAVIEVGAVHASKIGTSGLDLTLTSYLAGPRFYYRRPGARFVPYGQVLLGAVRATGGLAPANSGGAPSSTVFSATLGGGVEFNISRTITVRVAQVDYWVTTFDNKVDGHQNNIRITTGAAYHFGKR
jgi:peptidoglycan-associated lipoprotein